MEEPTSSSKLFKGSYIDQRNNWPASQESTLNFPGPEQIIIITN